VSVNSGKENPRRGEVVGLVQYRFFPSTLVRAKDVSKGFPEVWSTDERTSSRPKTDEPDGTEETTILSC
jgi:hypothetical protein